MSFDPSSGIGAAVRRRRLRCALTLMMIWTVIPAEAQERLLLVRDRRPVSIIVHGEADAPAAQRLVRRIEEWTGVRLERVADADARVAAAASAVVIGSPESNRHIAELTAGEDLPKTLGDEGLLIRTSLRPECRRLLLAGATPLGALFATSEFLSWQVRIDDSNAWVEAIDVRLRPALPMRMMWSSVGGANWPGTHAELHRGQVPTGMAAAIKDTASYLEHTRRLTDFLCEHKYNGLIFWGFAGDVSGGVEPARKMSRYAKENGVRVLPLIGTGTYGGFYHGDHPFNITSWAKKHPDARCQKMDAAFYDESIAPCHPESTKFFRDGAEWLFSTFPDIGGVNLENGDWMSCWNPECSTAKEQPENDPNFYWDMMASQRDIIEIGLKHQPDAWMTFATYTPFTELLIRRDLGKAIQQKLAKEVVYPPRFVQQVHPKAIAQWTVSGMNSDYLWPATARPPSGRLTRHLAFTHLNSFYGQKFNDARWWAEPNATFDEASPILFFQIPQAMKTGFEGFVVKGFVGDASPANELFYLAGEELMWNPACMPDQFVKRRLSVAYGGETRAARFLELLRRTTRDAAQLAAEQSEARDESQATSGDPRVSRRWQNLADELGRRLHVVRSTHPAPG